MNDEYRHQYARAIHPLAEWLTPIAEYPYDNVRLAAFADWLDEHDQPALAHHLRREALEGSSNNWWDMIANSSDPHAWREPASQAVYGITPLGEHGDFDLFHQTEGGRGQTPTHVITFIPKKHIRLKHDVMFHVETSPGEETEHLAGLLDYHSPQTANKLRAATKAADAQTFGIE